MFLWWLGKNCYSLTGKFWSTHCIHQPLHLWVSIYFGLYKILLMEKISVPWESVKGTWNRSSFKKIKSFGKMELWSCLKNGRKKENGTKWWIRYLIVISENEKHVFYFYLKNEETFWPTQYMAALGEGNGNPLQYSCLGNPMDGGACGLQSMGSLRVRYDWATSLSLFTLCIGGNGNPLQYSCLENPRDRGAWWAAVCGVAQSRTRLKWLSSKITAMVTEAMKLKDIYSLEEKLWPTWTAY